MGINYWGLFIGDYHCFGESLVWIITVCRGLFGGSFVYPIVALRIAMCELSRKLSLVPIV